MNENERMKKKDEREITNDNERSNVIEQTKTNE